LNPTAAAKCLISLEIHFLGQTNFNTWNLLTPRRRKIPIFFKSRDYTIHEIVPLGVIIYLL
jgi:hypothetical protein